MSVSVPVHLLALDTATEFVHLALVAPGQVLARTVGGGAQASTTALPEIQSLLSEAGVAWEQLDAVAFGQGPGAFTGLRTACALAQGLALGLERPVLALDTLMAIAEAARAGASGVARALAEGPDTTLWVLQDARMSEVYAAPYRWDGEAGGWQALARPVLWSLGHLQDQVEAGVVRLAAGSALQAYPDRVAALASSAGDARAQPHGAALAALALQAWRRGEAMDPALALPLYVRDKVAQTTVERQALARPSLETPT